MSKIEFDIQSEHEDFLESLEDYEIISENDNGVIEYLDKNQFVQLGLGLFLHWLFEEEKKSTSQLRSYHFIKLDEKYVLFLYTTEKDAILNGYNRSNIFIENILHSIPSGDKECAYCPKYKILGINALSMQMNHDYLKNFSFDRIPSISKYSLCEDCTNYLVAWLTERIIENEKYSSMLGGVGVKLGINPKILRYFVEENEPERTFNSYLSTKISIDYQLTYSNSNTRLKKPFSSKEIDALAYDPKNRILYLIETTRERKIDRHHLKRKIYNAVVMDGLSLDKYVYIYMTLGKEDKFNSYNHGCVNLLGRLNSHYKLNFRMLDRPKYLSQINVRELPPSSLQKMFNHYLNGIESIINDQNDI